jgi:type II secretory pathway predicted ATPase ExeA
MLSDVMDYYGLAKDFSNAGYFETDNMRQTFKDMKAAIKMGRLIALSGIVGCGKTTTLRRIQELLDQEKEILVAKSLSVDKAHINLNTLIMALFFDLAQEKDFKMPTQPEKRERKLRELIKKRQKPVALFIDEAHDLHGKTLIGLKRLIEVVQDGGGMLSIVLAGHPKLRNDLRRATMEEIGSRTMIFVLEGIKSNGKEYIEWLLNQCLTPKTERADIFSDDAISLLAEKLITPLQIAQHLSLAFEEAYRIGQKQITPDVIKSTMASDINAMEPWLTRNGYNVKTLADILNVRSTEIKSFFRGQLATARAQELKNEMLAVGIPV